MGLSQRTRVIILSILLLIGTFITFKIINKLSGYNVSSFNLNEILADKINEKIDQKKQQVKAAIKGGGASGFEGSSAGSRASGVAFGGAVVESAGGGGMGVVGGGSSVQALANVVERSGGSVSSLSPEARGSIGSYSRMSNSELRQVYNELSPSQKAKVMLNKDKIKRALGR